MNKRLGFVVVAALLALGLMSCGKSSSSNSAIPESGSGAIPIVVKPTDIIRGDTKAPVTMLEYASMTCPHCGRWDQEVLPKLYDTYIKTGKVRYIFREFPLDGAARMASALARCETGDGFYSMIDLLFRNQPQWEKDTNGDGQVTKEDIDTNLVQMGRVAGLSQQQVETCINDQKNLGIVDQNAQDATTTYNVNSTPTFILDGNVHVGEWKWEELDAAIKARLAAH